MEEKDLLNTLENLERDLQSVNSARQQVEEMKNAYNAIGIQLNNYVNSLAAVSDNINQMVNVIKNERSTLNTTLEASTKTRFKELNDEIVNFKKQVEAITKNATNAIKKLDNQHKEATENTLSTLQSQSSTITDRLNDSCEGIQQNFDATTTQTSQNLDNKVSEMITALEQAKTELHNVLNQFHDLQQHIEKTMQNYRKPILEKIGDVRSQLDVIHQEQDFQKKFSYFVLLILLIIILILIIK